MSRIRWVAIVLNAVVLLATLAIFFADHRSFGAREILHYALIGLFAVTPVISLIALRSSTAQTGTPGVDRNGRGLAAGAA